jgi:hypothetical protein
MAELALCQVLCKTCHLRKTVAENGGEYTVPWDAELNEIAVA